MLDKVDLSLKDKAENLVAFARGTHENDLDKVIEEVLNFAQEQRLELLQEVLQLLRKGANESVIEKRQRQETAKFSKGKTI